MTSPRARAGLVLPANDHPPDGAGVALGVSVLEMAANWVTTTRAWFSCPGSALSPFGLRLGLDPPTVTLEPWRPAVMIPTTPRLLEVLVFTSA